jgi:prohibitin 2
MSNKLTEGQELGDDSIRARTSDGQEVSLDTSVIFRINLDQAVLVHIDWQNRYVQDFVRPIIRGFVRTQVSQFTVKEVNSSARKDLEAALNRLVQEEFAAKGLIMDKFLVRDIAFSPEYASAIEQKQVALEGKEEQEHIAEQIRLLGQGRADALKLIADALQAHPDLVTYRYVEKLSPNVRVMLVPSGNPLILPLPSLGEALGVAPSDQQDSTDQPQQTDDANPFKGVLDPFQGVLELDLDNTDVDVR